MDVVDSDVVSEKILCVDDEPNILSSLRRLFRSRGFDVTVASSGKEGLECLASQQFSLVISDMRMPEMDGAQFLEQVRLNWPDCVRILLTGYSEVSSIIKAINRGEIHRYIAKPWEEEDLLLIVRQSLERRHLIGERDRLLNLTKQQNEELKQFNASLEQWVTERTEELRAAHEKLKENFITSIKVFSSLIESRNGKMSGHARRVADAGRKIAITLGLSDAEVQDIFIAGLLIDIGKIGLPDEVLNLPLNKMTGEQLGQFQKHTQYAEQYLLPVTDLFGAARILRSHQERYDGKGYPDKLFGEAIPVGAAILAIASDYDNLQTGNLLQRRVPADEAFNIIIRSVGARYSERIVDAFKKTLQMQDVENPDYYEVPVKNLMDGMVLYGDLFSREGTLLVPANSILNQHLIEQLTYLNISNGGKMMIKIRNDGSFS